MARRRLDSWKEIGAYLGRDARTAQRWEREEALPVQRHRHRAGSSVYAFAEELDAWRARRRPRAGAEDGTAMVLPLSPGGAGELRYWAQGLAEAIAGALASQAGMKVVAWLAGRGEAPDPRAAARDLRARWVIAATLSRGPGGRGVAISMEAVEGASGHRLWSARERCALGEMAAREPILAAEAARRMAGGSGGGGSAPTAPPAATAQSPAVTASAGLGRGPAARRAELLWRKGRYFWNRPTPANLRRAERLFTAAAAAAPEMAAAHAGRADALIALAYFGLIAPRPAWRAAEAAARRARALDPALAEPWAALGNMAFLSGEAAEAEANFAAALGRNPGYAAGRYWRALALAAAGRGAEALQEMEAAAELDPLSFVAGVGRGTLLYLLGKPSLAAACARGQLALEPESSPAWMLLGLAAEALGENDRALGSFQRAARLAPGEPACLGAWGHSLALGGDAAGAKKILIRLRALARRRFVSRYEFAVVCAGLGRASLAHRRRALRELRAAAAEGAPLMAFAHLAPRLAGLRDLPGFPSRGVMAAPTEWTPGGRAGT